MLWALGPVRLLVQHTCICICTKLYLYRTYMSLIYEIQYNYSVFLIRYQSHCSDLFLEVLSLLVLLHSQHCFRHHNSRCSLSPLNLRRLPSLSLGSGPVAAIVEESNIARITAHVIPPRLLLQSNFWWYHWDRLETIYSSGKALPSSELPRALTRRLNFLHQCTMRSTHHTRHPKFKLTSPVTSSAPHQP